MNIDPFKLEPSSIRRRKRSVNWLPIAIGVLGFAFLGLMVFLLKDGPSGASGGSSSGRQSKASVGSQGHTDRRLMAFVQEFLLYYYNYSYTLYPQAIQKAEAMMTQDMLKAYSNQARNRDFYNDLVAKKVSTSALRVVPGSVSIGEQDNRTFVNLGLIINYTTGINGASAEYPASVTLEVWDTEQGYKVNNIERYK